MTPQQQIQQLLERALTGSKINVFGSHIIVETRSEQSARRAFRVLSQFCRTVRQPKKSVAYNKKNAGTNLLPSTHTVWLVGAVIR